MRWGLTILISAVLLFTACRSDDPDTGESPNSDRTQDTQADAAESDADQDAAPDAAPDADRDESADSDSDRSDWTEIDYDPTVDIDLSELPHADGLVVDKLDNGLSYYLRSHDAPNGVVEVRLVVRAGSVNEPEGAGSTARYLAHVLFKGTKRHSGEDIRQVLNDLGIKVDPDALVSSSWDETVYSLPVKIEPDAGSDTDEVAGPANVRQAFDLLAEMATAALLAPEDVSSERRAILNEHRQASDSGSDQVGLALDDLYIAGTPYQDKHPIGDPDAITSMTSETLREFYEAWYQPPNMAVVVVGDLPTALLEDLVEEFFSDLNGGAYTSRGISEAVQPLDGFTAELNPDPVVESLTIEGAGPTRLSLDWAVPAWPEGTVGGERRILMEELIILMIENRLFQEFIDGDLALTDSPLIQQFPTGNALRFYGTNFTSADLPTGLTDFLSVLEGAAEFGFTRWELAQAVAAMRAYMEAEFRALPTTTSRDYADLYVQHYLRGAYIDTEASRFNWYKARMRELTAGQLSSHWQWVWDRSGPIVVPYGEVGHAVPVPTVEEMIAAIRDVEPRYVQAQKGETDTLLVRR